MRDPGQSLLKSRAAPLLLLAAPVLAALFLVATIGALRYWAKSEVVRRAAEAGVEVERADVAIALDGTAELRDVRWSAGGVVATIESVEIEIALSSLLSTPRVDRVVVRGLDAEVRQPAENSATATAPTPGRVARIINEIGGTPPELVVERARVRAELGPERLVEVAFESGEGVVQSGRWRFTAPARLAAPSVDGLVLPANASVEAELVQRQDRWDLDAVALRFPDRVRLDRDGVTVTVSGVGLSGAGHAMLADVAVAGVSSWVPGEAKIRRIEAGPLSAVAAREVEKLELVRISGADVTVQQPPGDARRVAKGTDWNRRVADLLDAAFSSADELLAKATPYRNTRIELVASSIHVPRLDATLAVKRAHLHQVDDGPDVAATFGWVKDGKDHGALELRYAPKARRVAATAQALQLDGLSHLAKRAMSGAVTGNIAIAATEHGYPLEGRLDFRQLRFESRTLASQPIEVPSMSIEFAGKYDPEHRAGSVTTERGKVKIGEVAFDARPAVFGLSSLPESLPDRVELELALEPTPLQLLVDAVPTALLGPLQGAKLAGTFGVTGRVEVPLTAPERMKWDLEPRVADVAIVSLPHDVDVRRLLTSATYTLVDEKIDHELTIFAPAPGTPGKEWIPGEGCGSYVYVPMSQISPHLVSGVLTTEDRGFLWHDGFNTNALRESLAANIAEGRIVRGGSTITMQLVKNLFLSREKTVARKLAEMFLVWLAESVVDVPKARLLELYFNVIEYGPKVFGIWHAATYFFGKHPRDLTVGEVAWFITTLTGPKIYHHQFLKRQISESVWGRMRARIEMMYHNDYITELDLVMAKAEPPRFREASCAPHSSAPRAPTANEEALATELLRLRRSGVERDEVTRRLNDPLWRAKALTIGRLRGQVDWDALPTVPDRYGWWGRP